MKLVFERVTDEFSCHCDASTSAEMFETSSVDCAAARTDVAKSPPIASYEYDRLLPPLLQPNSLGRYLDGI